MNQKLLAGFAVAGLMMSGMASASITSATTFNLNNLPGNGVNGTGGLLANLDTPCTVVGAAGGSGCYDSNTAALNGGIRIGLVSAGSHYHVVAGTNKAINTVSDSNGIYLTTDDRTAFGLTSFSMNALTMMDDPTRADANYIYGANPLIDANDGSIHPEGSSFDAVNGWTDAVLPASAAGPQEYWEILGFNTAINPTLDAGDGTNYSTRVAYQTVANGTNGLISLNASFNNVSAVWVHYHGYAAIPTNGIGYNAFIDNITLAPAAVPVPAAVWLFGSSLLGLVSFGRKKVGLAA